MSSNQFVSVTKTSCYVEKKMPTFMFRVVQKHLIPSYDLIVLCVLSLPVVLFLFYLRQ
jgi:hypothetical protein